MEKTKKQKKRRQYYLHYKLRKMGYRIATCKKTIFINAVEMAGSTTEKLPKQYMHELKTNYSYGIQGTI